jgi:hypothetical protein
MDADQELSIPVPLEEITAVELSALAAEIEKMTEVNSETEDTTVDSCTPVPPSESDTDGLSLGTLSLSPSLSALQEDGVSESEQGTPVTPASTPCSDPTVAAVRALLPSKLNELLTDSDCSRFLRARSHNVKKAADMISKWGEWWETPLPGTDILPGDVTKNPDEQEPIYTEFLPHANLGESKAGCPIYWEKTGQSKRRFLRTIRRRSLSLLFPSVPSFHSVSSIFQTVKKHLSEDQLFVRHIRQQEVMVRRLNNASARHNRPIEKQVIVMDMKNVAMSLDFMALRVFKSTVVIDESCYPERLETLFMINAPFTFSVLWAMIKPWIDPVTVNKFRIIGTNYQDALKEAIAEDQIPVEYGGTWEDFGWTYPKNIAQRDRMPHY